MTKPRISNATDPRVACYVRVSTSEQGRADKPSLAQQEEKVRQACVVDDWEITHVYSDVVTGKKWERPDLQRMLADAEAGQFARVVFLKIDRLARNTRDLLEISERLNDLGVGVVSVKEKFDTSTPIGWFYFILLGAIAELEAGMIAERTSDGRKGKVASGAYLASIAPYGYIADRVNKTLVLHPEQSKVVEDIYRWYTEEGLSLTAVASRLAEQEIPPPDNATDPIHLADKWHTTMISRILRDKRYTGEGAYGDMVMRCPSIVSVETYEAARESASRRKQFSPRNTKRSYLVQHLARCRRCGSLCGAVTVGGRKGSIPYYVCKSKKHGRRTYWQAGQVEPQVQAWVLRFLDDPEAALAQAKLHIEQQSETRVAQQAERRRLTLKLAGYDGEEQKVLEWGRKGSISEPAMLQQLGSIKGERAATLSLLEALDLADAERISESVEASFLLGAVKQMRSAEWRERHHVEELDQLQITQGDPAQWQATIRSLVNTVWLEQDGSVSVQGVLSLANASPPSCSRATNSNLRYELRV